MEAASPSQTKKSFPFQGSHKEGLSDFSRKRPTVNAHVSSLVSRRRTGGLP